MPAARQRSREEGVRDHPGRPEYLEQNKSSVDEIFDRISDFATSFFGPPMIEVHQAFKNVARATYATATRLKDPEQLKPIKDTLDRAVIEGSRKRQEERQEKGESG